MPPRMAFSLSSKSIRCSVESLQAAFIEGICRRIILRIICGLKSIKRRRSCSHSNRQKRRGIVVIDVSEFINGLSESTEIRLLGFH